MYKGVIIMKEKNELLNINHVKPPKQPGLEYQTENYTSIILRMNKHCQKSDALFSQFTVTDPCTFELLPDGCCSMLFNCNGDEQDSHMIGILTQKHKIQLQKNSDYFGVKFYSTFGIKNWKLEPTSLVDNVESVPNSIYSKGLARGLGKCTNFPARIRFLKKFYQQHWLDEAYRPGPVEQCALLICASEGTISGRELARRIGYSSRYIRDLFEKVYGISPKQYSMLKRYHNALHLLFDESHPSSYIASDVGYYDQTHFIKEFESFTKMSPLAYVHMVCNQKKHDHLTQ